MLGEVGLDIRRCIPRIQIDRDGNDPQKVAPLIDLYLHVESMI